MSVNDIVDADVGSVASGVQAPHFSLNFIPHPLVPENLGIRKGYLYQEAVEDREAGNFELRRGRHGDDKGGDPDQMNDRIQKEQDVGGRLAESRALDGVIQKRRCGPGFER